MRYPIINRQPRREVNVPELSGGLNLRDSLTGVRDNQMTDCVNMWYKNGSLRTRPPFVTNLTRTNVTSQYADGVVNDTRFHNEVRIFYNGYDCVLATNKRSVTGDGTISHNIEFEFQAADKIFVMPKISGIAGENITYFCAEMSGTLYCYISDSTVWKLEYNKETAFNETTPVWVKIQESDMYVPTVLAHGMPTDSGYSYSGTLLEGYNLLTARYKMVYSTYNVKDENHNMRYSLLSNLPTDTAGIVTAKIIHSDGSVKTHSVNWTGGGNTTCYEQEDQGDGLWMFVNQGYVMFSPSKSSATVKTLSESDYVEDNLEIISFYKHSADDLKKIFNMTQSVWFGGAANGINGGSRLFVCGNTDEKEKSLVVWSGLNNPLYFSENCYTYVGSKSRAVTAFGKQGENLIIFKENKIYAAYYQQNNNIDADDLINQSVVDYDANSTYFPIMQINGYIGCDCPDTVQMCRNRLVWATSEGKVYTLCTMSQYNEHTVYDLSDMIAPKLKEYKDKLKTATSADFAGHYVLFLGDCAFVMDYCSYGYQYVYSYSKTDDANALIPWYYWEFDFLKGTKENDKYERGCICALDGNMILRAYFDASVEEKSAFVGFVMDEKQYSGADSVLCNNPNSRFLQTESSTIKSRAVTKLFELGGGIYYVNVDGAVVKTGSNDGKDIIVNFVTEQGKETEILKDRREHKGETSLNFIRGKVLRPSIRNIIKFGLDFECDGQLCIDGLTLKYRLLGGVK